MFQILLHILVILKMGEYPFSFLEPLSCIKVLNTINNDMVSDAIVVYWLAHSLSGWKVNPVWV